MAHCAATLVGCWSTDTRFDFVRADGGTAAFVTAVVFDLVFHAGGLLAAFGASADAHRLARSLHAESCCALCCCWLLRCAGFPSGILGAG